MGMGKVPASGKSWELGTWSGSLDSQHGIRDFFLPVQCRSSEELPIVKGWIVPLFLSEATYFVHNGVRRPPAFTIPNGSGQRDTIGY